jgi:predicted site-specific integrase-resolvase
MTTQPKIQRWFSKREIAGRYGVSMRSVERWVDGGKFPAPTRMPNGRDYWPDTTIEAHEQNLVIANVKPEGRAGHEGGNGS